ncbi:jg26795 [Pararge aegeria aegeria]|uniref:Jg26795 protein n=1 Tax=Pararge aegeria aegeria TaxID=348720 RepID=A0A8S4S8S5_9NEOP|nr:jg26795 [Pararge aegeria aegeria]
MCALTCISSRDFRNRVACRNSAALNVTRGEISGQCADRGVRGYTDEKWSRALLTATDSRAFAAHFASQPDTDTIGNQPSDSRFQALFLSLLYQLSFANTLSNQPVYQLQYNDKFISYIANDCVLCFEPYGMLNFGVELYHMVYTEPPIWSLIELISHPEPIKIEKKSLRQE